METLGIFVILMLILVGLGIYLIPTLIAYSRKRQAKTIVLIINVFFGWSIIGWCIALFIALTKDDEPDTVVVRNYNTNSNTSTNFDQLIKLNELLEKNVITKDEFELEKSKILK